jgi:hypothetical protein
MEKLYPQFDAALALGKHNEDVLAHEFSYQGLALRRTEGKHPFDFYLPNGKSLEVKIDLRSQCTGCGAIEAPTLARNADYYLYTFTTARVYPHVLLEELFKGGKRPSGGFGGAGYDGRYVPGMMNEGVSLHEFIQMVKASLNN